MQSLTTTPTATLISLTSEQRRELKADLDRDGFAVLPGRLPLPLMQSLLVQIDELAQAQRAESLDVQSVKDQNCVRHGGAMLELMTYEPALQMCCDVFGPVYQLNQSNFISRVNEPPVEGYNSAVSIDWHADGPRPANFPKVINENGPAMGLHYLKFGYFLTDLTHHTGGSLQVVRGSHLRPELDERGGKFDITDYDDDLIQFDVEAGSIVAFHQALWHAAYPNDSEIERKNLYYSYCPRWMRPLDYELPRAGEKPNGLEDLSKVEAFLLGEYRKPLEFWLLGREDRDILKSYMRS